jgi:hypothetical protein
MQQHVRETIWRKFWTQALVLPLLQSELNGRIRKYPEKHGKRKIAMWVPRSCHGTSNCYRENRMVEYIPRNFAMISSLIIANHVWPTGLNEEFLVLSCTTVRTFVRVIDVACLFGKLARQYQDTSLHVHLHALQVWSVDVAMVSRISRLSPTEWLCCLRGTLDVFPLRIRGLQKFNFRFSFFYTFSSTNLLSVYITKPYKKDEK